MENWVIWAVLVLIVLIVIGLYNRIVSLVQRRKNAFSDIDVQLKQRSDLIPNLVETVKGYASHEKGVFERVTEARAAVQRSNTMGERAKSEGALGAAMMGLFAVAENYPQLKADGSFQQLQAELSDIENKISAARRFFNNSTNEYNAAIAQFPAVFLAKIFGFKEESFFELDDAEKEAVKIPPKVNFG